MPIQWQQRLPATASAGDDARLAMTTESGSEGRTIEERYELEVTRVGLGLAERVEPFAVGNDGRYYIEELLGHGSMGAVYRARDRELDRPVALKVVAAARRVDLRHSERRLRQEARALARLRHDNVVTVYDLATTENDELFLAMEYVKGTTLAQWQRERSVDEVLEAYLQAGEGLAAAHRTGCVHRDFKPDNVFVEDGDGQLRVKVGDFGLAGISEEAVATEVEGGGDERLTSPQGMLGTLPYMAPEQLRREPADARSDQHQFCVSLWEGLSSKRPFPDNGRSPDAGLELLVQPAKMPNAVYRTLVRGLAFERAERFESMDALLRALRTTRAWRRSRRWFGAGILLAGGTAAAVWPSDPCAPLGRSLETVWTEKRGTLVATLDGAVPSLSNLEREAVTAVVDQAYKRSREGAISACEAHRASGDVEAAAMQSCFEQLHARVSQTVEKVVHLDSDELRGASKFVAPLWDHRDACAVARSPLDAEVGRELAAIELERQAGSDQGLRSRAEALVEMAKERGTAEGCRGVDVVDGEVPSIELSAANFMLGAILADLGESEKARAKLELAQRYAFACHDDQWFGRAKLRTAALVAVVDQKPGPARWDWAQGATALSVKGAGSETQLYAYEVEKVAGLIALRNSEFGTAIEHFRLALGELGDENRHPFAAARLHVNIGMALHLQGEYELATVEQHKARSLYDVLGEASGSDATGPSKTSVNQARAALNRGITAMERGDFDKSRVDLDLAARTADPLVALDALNVRAQLTHLAKEGDAAQIWHARELDERMHRVAAAGAVDGSLKEALARAWTTAGQVLAHSGRDRGFILLREAAERWARLERADERDDTLFALTELLVDAKRYSEAVPHVEDLLGRAGELSDERLLETRAFELRIKEGIEGG